MLSTPTQTQVVGTTELRQEATSDGTSGLPSPMLKVKQLVNWVICRVVGVYSPLGLLTQHTHTSIGAAHAGWRGAVDGILEATIAMMAKQGITPDQIEAVIGPAIQQANYQVGDDLRHAVLAAHDDAEVFFDPDQDMDGKYRFDLPGFVQSRLRKAGLDKVTNLGIDTYGESSGLFSHRHATHAALPDSGRQISVIGLVQNPTPKMT